MFHFRVTNSKLKNKKSHFEFLTRSWKIISPEVTNSMVKLIFFRFRVTNLTLKNNKFQLELLTRCVHFYFLTFELRTWSWWIKKKSLIIAVSKWHGLRHSIMFFVFSLLCCKYIYDIYLSMLDFNGLCKFKNIFIKNITEEIQ